ncbi:MAG: DUF3562 domain-containing protein [Steroidobacteraceae bacterium]
MDNNNETEPSASTNELVARIAGQTGIDASEVARRYNDELNALMSEARIKSFVGIIAARRTREQLRDGARAGHIASPA